MDYKNYLSLRKPLQRKYIHGFSHNPLPAVFALILIVLCGLALLDGLTQTEITHCLQTSTVKNICH